MTTRASASAEIMIELFSTYRSCNFSTFLCLLIFFIVEHKKLLFIFAAFIIALKDERILIRELTDCICHSD